MITALLTVLLLLAQPHPHTAASSTTGATPATVVDTVPPLAI